MNVERNHPTVDAAMVAPRLWIGSQAPPGDTLANGGFEVLVLCAEEWQPPSESFPGVKVIHAPFDDDPEGGMSLEEMSIADWASTLTAQALKGGKTCLVTCRAGRNRSGLVTAMALSKATGLDPALAGELVRRRRGHAALTNEVFVNLLNALRGEHCELCEGKELTRRFHEDPVCWVAMCKSCDVPMVVLRRHSVTPTAAEEEHMIDLLKLCAPPKFKKNGYVIDQRRQSIPQHWHAHLRPLE